MVPEGEPGQASSDKCCQDNPFFHFSMKQTSIAGEARWCKRLFPGQLTSKAAGEG
jgi:hypothetical protein